MSTFDQMSAYLDAAGVRSYAPPRYGNSPVRFFSESPAAIGAKPTLGNYVPTTPTIAPFVPSNMNTNFMTVPYPQSFSDYSKQFSSGPMSSINLDTSGGVGGIGGGIDPNSFGSQLGTEMPETTLMKDKVPEAGIPLTDKLNTAANLLTAGFGAYNGYQANKTARKQLAFQIDAFNRNFEAQKGTTNAQLADRQNIRNIEHPGQFDSVDAYMTKYGVK